MGAVYKTSKIVNPGRSVFIATPAYERVMPGFAYALAMTTAELTRRNIPFELGIMAGNCHVDDGRNSLVRDFLEGNCTDMFFIDADVMWTPKDVVRMLAHEGSLVCGAYPKKCAPPGYPIGRIFKTHPDGMLEVSYAPTGFMRIRREVFEKLLPLQSKHGKERPTAIFFERRFNGATRDGGDVTFCRKWIAAGGRVLVDPSLVLSHIGENRWSGRFLDYLSRDENRARHFEECPDPLIDKPTTHSPSRPDNNALIPYWVEQLKTNPSPETFQALADAYGNKPWAATWDFHLIAHKMASALPEGSTIVECGCGLSTLVLAATGHTVLALEEHAEWAEKVDNLLAACGLEASIKVAPIAKSTGWYGAGKGVFRDFEADMLVIDGPRRRETVDRMWPLKNGVLKQGGTLLVDDVSSVEAPGEFVQCGTGQRPFVAGKFGESND
jgi:hypothetical protein